jgi:hypothetical protein
MPFTIVTQGTFTSAGVGVKIPIPSSADYFRVQNLTQLATTQATGRVVMAEYYPGIQNANDGIRWKKTNSTSAMNADLFSTSTASDGFTYVTVAPTVEAQAANAITGITAANPAVVTQTNTYSNGDIIRIYNTTGMLQIAGMDFQISSVSGAGYTLLGLPATASNGFAAAATAGNTRRISKFGAVEPQFLYITNISQALEAVVSTSVDPSNHYAVGMKIHFSIPSSLGMVEMDQLTGTIVAVNAVAAASDIGAYNLTVDIDSSAFTAFAFPASTSSPTAPLFATLAPAGARTRTNTVTNVTTGYDFNLQPFRTGEFTPYMFLAGGAQSPAGSSGDVIVWQAYKMETANILS